MASDSHMPEAELADQVQRKRKASLADTTEDGSPKRPKQQDDTRDPGRPRRASSPRRNRRESNEGRHYDEASRQKPATLEEKKRGRRLFGGLLNTLSQTSTSSHQQRRQEIEKRQQERQKKQKAEDDQKNEERFAQLREIRMGRQLEFEKEVMHQKHSRLLWQSRHLKTKAEPVIFYSPWKLTGDQENVIDEQISAAKNLIETELEAFKEKERLHAEKYGSRSSPRVEHEPQNPAQEPPEPGMETETEKKDVEDKAEPEPEGAGATASVVTTVHHHHDDSEDVVVEGDEDTVIY
ncbi:unnamed protein product [Clonostachys rosea f. rosea IK726]|uniref:Uncharacterized protein n=2 Tax=Bionectria ochroleuca TaxID=29856 RepID=A0ACA9T9Y8_BIOOC|nr:unnamed protein product [Clonostachys rosea f. rosea IK726]